MNWIIFMVITMLSYAGFYFFSRFGANYLDSRLAPFVLNLTAAVIIFSYLSYFLVNKQKLSISSKGIFMVVIAGLCAAIGNISNFRTYELGGPGPVVIPFTAIGSLLIATTLSIIVLKEQFSLVKAFGLLLGLVGMYFVVV